MINRKHDSHEALPTEDRKVAAKSLALDKTTSAIAYETATFGIG